MIAWNFVELEETGSTQSVARGLAAMGAPEGTTVVAKSQSSGEGRFGRAWISPDGGLYMSFILRPGNTPRPEVISLISAVAVAQGVQHSTKLSPVIRWPNDVMLGGKKLGGVIAEAQAFKQEITQMIVGVGVNCNGPLSGSTVESEATSLIEEQGQAIEISELKHSILDAFSGLYERWKAGEDLAPQWARKVGTAGKRVSVKMKTEETPFSCDAQRVDLDGWLVVIRDGAETALHAEDVEWLRETS